MRERQIFYIGLVLIIISGIFAFTWYKLESDKRQHATQQLKTQQQNELQSDAKEVLDNSLLQTCMDNATNRYPWENVEKDTQRDPANTQKYLDLYYQMKADEEASCKVRYGN